MGRREAYERAEKKREDFVESIHQQNAVKREYMAKEQRAREVGDALALCASLIDDKVFFTTILDARAGRVEETKVVEQNEEARDGDGNPTSAEKTRVQKPRNCRENCTGGGGPAPRGCTCAACLANRAVAVRRVRRLGVNGSNTSSTKCYKPGEGQRSNCTR